ncbi:hypothetical protein [Comamonas sp. JUb58]|uniref:hypothetical protein n=1 Tax=Comamonas sp. JUb58 TaxID=2485114 RepID=UPI001414EC03|nr:hypothetical protein [Comamonas sp. JUb58]
MIAVQGEVAINGMGMWAVQQRYWRFPILAADLIILYIESLLISSVLQLSTNHLCIAI